MKAIIVDDEPRAIELLKGYIQHFNTIELVGTFRSGLKAFDYINTEPVELIFLDINMPQLSGISLSKMIDPAKTKIIFTTAYAEYAVESYEVDAVDYLLKPISLERFTKTMSKLFQQRNDNQKQAPEYLVLKSGSKRFPVRPEDILYLEKDGNYMIYHLKDQRILARESIAQALEYLPDHFLQTHKSYIVNTRRIEFFNRETVSVNGRQLPIGKAHRETFHQFMVRQR